MTPTPPRAPRQFPNFGRPVRRTRNTVTFDSSPVIVTPTQGYPPPSSVALNLTPSTPTVNGGYNGSDDEIEEDEEEDEGVNGHDHDEERQDDEDEDVHDMDDEDDEVGDEVDGDEHGGEEGDIEAMDIDQRFDAAKLGLKEIGNLASWTVSSCKPGCGVEALRDESTDLFWQSDGPQPHHLNIHFSRFVAIRAIRIFLNFDDDESYTPTRITLLAGTGYHDLIPFTALEFSQPKGWIDVPLDRVGGGEDGRTLRAFLVQVRIVENHQNGKDTHVRGLKIYAKDERSVTGGLEMLDDKEQLGSARDRSPALRKAVAPKLSEGPEFTVPDWMGEPELR